MSERDDLTEQQHFIGVALCPELRCLKRVGHAGKHTPEENN